MAIHAIEARHLKEEDIETDAAYGRFDLASWLHEWKIDFTLRNGRTADALSRLWLRPGIVGARIILSFVALLAFFNALYLSLNHNKRE